VTFKLEQALLNYRWLLLSMIIKLIAMFTRLLVLFIIWVFLYQMQMWEEVLLKVVKAESFRRWIKQIIFTEILLDLLQAKGHPVSHYDAS
jgi:hypothetical protein